MITQTLIDLLKNDSQIQSLLGATSPDNCPVRITNAFDESNDKQINISYSFGITDPVSAGEATADIHDGRVIIYVLVKETISEPVNTINNIAKRILELLDLKGTTLSDSYTDTVYWIQKVDCDDALHYANLGFYELPIIFRYVIKE